MAVHELAPPNRSTESATKAAAAILILANDEWAHQARPVTRAIDAARRDAIVSLHIGAGAAEAVERIEALSGCLMLGFDPAAAKALRARHGDAILIVVSEDTPPDPVTCWFAQLPAPPVLAGLLGGLVPSQLAPTPHHPRRKTDTIVGNNPAMNDLLHACTRLAPSPSTVLINGETGTGKELIARALHFSGPRASRQFVALNCAAIPETMMEAELFGHQRGAFTGAVATRAGAFETAEGGTVFLDEIGELPLAMQPKLLRVLDSGEVTRLGSSTPIASTARVVVATNRDLEAEVGAGRFREDLYYRISTHVLRVPPLRERTDDIPLIVKHHLGLLAAREGSPVVRLTHTAINKLLAHRWPGNVRELIATVERAALTAKNSVIDAEDILFPRSAGPRGAVVPYREAKAEFERNYFSNLMRVANGNISTAATMAKKTRKEIYDALRRTGMRPVEKPEKEEK